MKEADEQGTPPVCFYYKSGNFKKEKAEQFPPQNRYLNEKNKIILKKIFGPTKNISKYPVALFSG